MRIVKVTTVYPAYIRRFYDQRTGLAERSYGEQRDALAFDSFGWADFWKHALAPLGHDVREVWANVAPMQRAWATEAGLAADEVDWVHSLALARIEAERPDVLFMDDYTVFSADWVAEARRRAPSIRLVVGWCGAPFQDASVFSAYDVVLSNIPELVAWFRAAGHVVHHVNHAFDPRVLERIAVQEKPDIAVSFVGQIERSANTHGRREQLLATLAESEDLQVFSPAAPADWSNRTRIGAGRALYRIARGASAVGVGGVAARLPVLGRAAAWQEPPAWPLGGALGRALRKPVFGLRMFETLRRSQVTLNSHIDLSKNSASNMRMFEATGAGTCLLTDAKQNLNSLFEADQEVVSYSSAGDCAEKARWLLENPGARDRIAAAGQKRTLRDHTFARRAPLLDEIFRRAMP